MRLLRAWLITGISDGLFSSVLAAFFYGSTVMRLWQGVASVPLGADALNGGVRTAAIGLAMHFGVALTWSVVFLALLTVSPWLRDFVSTPFGVITAAAIYGPIIWMTMSLVVVPLFTHRPPAINFRWWVQFFGHIPFVALPIVALLGRRGA